MTKNDKLPAPDESTDKESALELAGLPAKPGFRLYNHLGTIYPDAEGGDSFQWSPMPCWAVGGENAKAFRADAAICDLIGAPVAASCT